MHSFWSITKLRNLLTLFKYDPVKYWKTRGKVFYKENPYDGEEWVEIEKRFLTVLETMEFSSVLEFGCGFGRLTKLMLEKFPHIKEYKAIDLSSDQIENAKKRINSDKVDFEVTTIQDFKSEKKYDLVFGFAVFMHVPPKDIENVISKLTSVTKNHLVNCDWDDEETPKVRLANFCFVHDYKNIFNLNPLIKNTKKITMVEEPQHSSIYDSILK